MPLITVMDRELHEPLTVVSIPHGLMPTWPSRNSFVPCVIRFAIEDHYQPFFKTPMVDESFAHHSIKVVTLNLEPVLRGRGGDLMFWYAYAEEPELALLLRSAFYPGQVGEIQRLEAEARITGLFQGVGIGLRMGQRGA